MQKKYLQLIDLIRRVLKEDDNELNKELFPNLQDANMWKNIFMIAVDQEMQVFLYEATKNLGLPEQVKQNFYSVYNRAVRKEAIVHLEVEKFFEELNNARIVYLPIKGWNFKNLYPKPYLRTMTDVDLVVKKNNFEETCEIAKVCGFTLEDEGISHYVFMKKPVTELEIHHQLFSEKSVLYEFGKKLLDKNDDFTMSVEDTYVYMISHMAKHFTDNGAGMRNIIDCYLYNKCYQFSETQRIYIKNELKKIGLDLFEIRIRNLSEIWFEGKEYDSESILLAEYIMHGGLYGKAGNSIFIKLDNEPTNKYKWVIKEIFPGFEILKQFLKYKKMYRILTPIYWLFYIVKRLKRKGNVGLLVEIMTKDDDSNKIKQILDYVGLKTTKY